MYLPSAFSDLLQQVVQDLDGFVVASLRLIDGGDVVRDFDRILHHGLGFLQILERLIELALLAIDLRDAHVGLRIFRIGVGDDLVLFERGIGLAVVQQVLRQAANGVEIVVVQFDGVPIGIRWRSCIPSAARRCSRARNTAWPSAPCSGTELSTCVARVVSPSFVVEVSQRGDGFFGIRLQLDRRS